MAKEKVFRFKQFQVDQEHAAMKVGTDGVLLGAWASGGTVVNRMLDVGTGTGLIALMLAQRFPGAAIDAIDLSELSAQQALFNFAQAPWSDRLQAFHASLGEWVKHAGKQYDLLVCNPPFFANGWKVEDPGRSLARKAEHLPPAELAAAADRLLLPDGVWCVIIPEAAKKAWLQAASDCGWRLRSVTDVYTKKESNAERCLLAWDRSTTAPKVTALSLYAGEGFSDAYLQLVQDFYWNM